MKRYIIAIYIPWMLFFLAGCYSTRFLTYDELKVHKEDSNDISIVSKKRQEFLLVSSGNSNSNRPDCLYCTKWEVFNDSIKMTCLNPGQVKAPAKSSGQGIVPDQEIYTLLKSDIALISKEEFDTVSTVFLIGIPIITLTFGYLLMAFATAGMGN